VVTVAVAMAGTAEGALMQRLPLTLSLLVMLVGCGPEGNGGNNNMQTVNTDPLTVVVDTGQTMTVQGGQGVGVFVEYSAGGHWRVSWACDTSLSGLSCDFNVGITGTAIASATSLQFGPNDTLTTPSATQLAAATLTTTQIDEVDFDATAGTTIQVDVTVSGLRDGNFFFFVQDGKIDGNYQGPLTDPLIFEPSSS
jgi:hypothetical protein